jgi:hypothetical protein
MTISKYREKNLILIALFLLPFKFGYLLSRSIFNSGPDAVTFVKASEEFANKDFFSSDIAGIPYWPSGYPFLNSIVIRIVDGQWILLTQVIQVLLFSIACIFLYKLISPYCGVKLSFIGTLGLLMQPAWIAANGQAMYETYLISFLMAGFFLLLRPNAPANYKGKVLGLSLLGYSLVIHPRMLPVNLSALILFQVFFKLKKMKFASGLVIFSIFPIFFALRNFIAVKEFVLSNSLVATASSYNLVFKSCSSLECLPVAIFKDFPAFLSQGLTNVSAFFSPHWGPHARGTWFHNLSALKIFPEGFPATLIVQAGAIVSLTSILLLGLGMWRALMRHNFFDLFFVLSSIIFISTAFIVFGDNRTRLIASFFFLPLQLLGAQFLWGKFMHILKTQKIKASGC